MRFQLLLSSKNKHPENFFGLLYLINPSLYMSDSSLVFICLFLPSLFHPFSVSLGFQEGHDGLLGFLACWSHVLAFAATRGPISLCAYSWQDI